VAKSKLSRLVLLGVSSMGAPSPMSSMVLLESGAAGARPRAAAAPRSDLRAARRRVRRGAAARAARRGGACVAARRAAATLGGIRRGVRRDAFD